MLRNIEAEMSVLGACLLDPDAVDKVGWLKPGEFSDSRHSEIFTHILALAQAGEPVELASLVGRVSTGAGYLAELVNYVPTAANIGYYAKQVRSAALRREVVKIGAEATELAHSETDHEKVLDEVESRIMTLRTGGQSKGAQVATLLRGSLKRVEQRYHSPSTVTGLATGYSYLDYMTAGLHAGDLIIIAGRPSMGKTALALNLVENTRVPAVLFSMEMSKEQLTDRLLCSVSQVNMQDYRNGKLKDVDWSKLARGSEEAAKIPLTIDDTPALSVMEMRARARRYRPQLVVVDYLQLMRGNGKENRQQDVSEISRGLKGLARELRCPVIALSQLNRSLENRPNKRPIMADLRESGAIEQDADLIMFVYRETVYCDDCKARRCTKGHDTHAELIIGKQRNGPTGTVYLTYLGEYTRFEEAKYAN